MITNVPLSVTVNFSPVIKFRSAQNALALGTNVDKKQTTELNGMALNF